MAKTRSIVDISIQELEEILNTNQLPEGVDFSGIEKHKNFTKLFAHRTQPKLMAKLLLKEKLGAKGVLNEPLDMKRQRMELKKLELDLKAKKIKGTTWQFQKIWDALGRQERLLKLILAEVLTKEELTVSNNSIEDNLDFEKRAEEGD